MSPAILLDEVVAAIRQYVVIGRDEAFTLALWVLHTHVVDFAPFTPYMAVSSPEKGCGKSTLLGVLEQLVREAIRYDVTPSGSVMARDIQAGNLPTLLIDELDQEEDVHVAILNSGNKRGGRIRINVQTGSDWAPKQFNVYGAKALGGINHYRWHETVVDRCIPIILHKCSTNEIPPPWYEDDEQVEPLRALQEKLAAWGAANGPKLKQLTKDTPYLQGLSSPRATTGWQQLLVIAKAAGLEERAREVALSLSGDRDDDHASLGALLLRAIHDAFKDRDVIATEKLCSYINKRDDLPFGSWRGGQGIDGRILSTQLKPYPGFKGRKSTTQRSGDLTFKGYRREEFLAAWEAYCPHLAGIPESSVTPSQSSVRAKSSVTNAVTNRVTTTDAAVTVDW